MSEVDIVLPCYNPSINWEKVVVYKYRELQSLWRELAFHLYIVNDGSVYGFQEDVIDYLKKNIPDICIISYPNNRGKGFALRKAVKQCHSELLFYTDYDFPYTMQSVSLIIEMLLGGSDVVVATRDGGYYKCLPPFRRLVSSIFRFCNQYLLGMKFPDTQAGLKGFSLFGKEIFLSTRIDTYLFDWEFVYKVSKISSLTMRDVLVKLNKDIVFSRFGVSSYVTELKYYVHDLFKRVFYH